MQAENLLNGSSTSRSSGSNIFSIGHHSASSTSIYNYGSSTNTTSSPTAPFSSFNNQQIGGASSMITNANMNIQQQQQAQNQYVEIQAQFEMSCELRKFINIDLFQRGYYQIRLAVKCGNKQVPIKVIVQLENTQSNNNLSGRYYFNSNIDLILLPLRA